MRMPYWLLRLLPMWNYLCPACKKEVKKSSHECLHCDERFPFPVRVPPRCQKDPKALGDYVHKHIFPKVSASQREYLTQFFTVLFEDGFERGDFSAWSGTNGTVAIITDPVHHGTKAAKATGSGSWWRQTLASAYADLYVRFYVYFPTMLNVDDQGCAILVIHNSNWSERLAIFLRFDNGQTGWAIEAGGVENRYPTTVTAATWYCIEARRNATTGVATLWVNGVVIGNVTRAITGNSQHVISGCEWTNHANFIVDADCYVVADAYIGPEAPPANFTLTYQSNPIAVPCTVNGQTVNSGDGILIPSGTPVTISVPTEVTV